VVGVKIEVGGKQDGGWERRDEGAASLGIKKKWR